MCAISVCSLQLKLLGMSGLHLIVYSCVRPWPQTFFDIGVGVCEREFRRRTGKSYRVGRNFVSERHGRTH